MDSRIWILVYFVLMCEDADILNTVGWRCDSFFSPWHDVWTVFLWNFLFEKATMLSNSVSKMKCASVEPVTQNWFRYENIKYTCMNSKWFPKNQPASAIFPLIKCKKELNFALHKVRVVNKTFPTTKIYLLFVLYTA